MKQTPQLCAFIVLVGTAACGSSSESSRVASIDAGNGDAASGVPSDGDMVGTPDAGTSAPMHGDAGPSARSPDGGELAHDGGELAHDGGELAHDGGETAQDAGARDAGTPGMGDAAAVSCISGARRCVGQQAEICAESGAALHRVECSNGCLDGLCRPMSLETDWGAHQYQLLNDSVTTPALYTFENDGLIATQANNPMASLYYKLTPLPENVVITGRFSVRTTTDDDLIGFVFGWSDPEHYYLFDWKQSAQNDATCGLASAGASLKLVNADSEITDCTDFWSSAGTPKVSPLVGVDQNALGWKDNTDYDLRLQFKPGNIRISVVEVGGAEVVSISSTDATYRAGNFGFYNYSQQAVRYELFSISPLE